MTDKDSGKSTDRGQVSAEKPKPRKKRTSKQSEELTALHREKEELQDQLLRKVAEFDNYKKRTERSFLERIQNANERLITELLPVLDDMHRAIDHAAQEESTSSLFEGSELILKKLMALLEKEGLEKMSAIGAEFDPEKHDALMQVDHPEAKSGTIVEEHLKGYLLNGKVIRHAQVLVAK